MCLRVLLWACVCLCVSVFLCVSPGRLFCFLSKPSLPPPLRFSFFFSLLLIVVFSFLMRLN